MILFLIIFSNFKINFASAPLVINSVILNPELDISLFSPYTISADIDGLPESSTATAVVTGINGDGSTDWNYYTDGTADSDSRSYTLAYNAGLDKWVSGNVYPDSIYPEIYFAPSSTTWSNAPSNIITRRNNYQLLHFDNAFSMNGAMSFWVEFNAYRRSAVNSADLQVYLVEQSHDITYFQEDWRAKAGVELIGTITKDAAFNHSHNANSSHHLVSLSSNIDGTVGDKSLNIDNDFWIVLYNTSPNDARGWDLRYQSSSLCTNSGDWYTGSQAGWTTTAQTGCPDAHVHMARRDDGSGLKDGVKIVTSAIYGETATKTTNLYYNELPNLAPNATSFTSPTVGGTYEGVVSVAWDAASDANNDTLDYNIYLLDENGAQYGDALATGTTDLTLTFDTETPGSEIPNGLYSLSGEVCDQEPLCTDFALPGQFWIDNADPIYAASNISIVSNNANPIYADTGDTVTLTFTTSGAVAAPTIYLYSGGSNITNAANITNIGGTAWTASYVVSASDIDGDVSFQITSDSLEADYFDTTDDTYIIVDKTDPTDPTSSPLAGTYFQDQTVSLSTSGSDTIRYTLDGSNPNCSSGTLYSSPINISYSRTIKAIACDIIGHSSNLSEFYYLIRINGGTFFENLSDSNINQLIETVNQSVPLDKVMPLVKQTFYNLAVQVTVNNQPIPGLKVELHSDIQEAVTDQSGIAYFKNVLAGSHTIKTVYNNKTYEKTFDLNKETALLDQNINLEINFPLSEESKKEDFSQKRNWSWLILLFILILAFICLVYFFWRKRLKVVKTFF